MTLHRLPLALLASASLALTAPLRAQDPDLRELLRDALYTEEVTRNPESAAKQYEHILAQHDAQRAFAAAALFRLAEVRRKQDRKDEAIALYQRLLREFPAAETEGKLARENLTAMGAKIDIPASLAADEEAIELQRLQQWVESSPDRLKDPELLLTAIKEGRLESLKLLLKAGAAGQPWKLLEEAVRSGNLKVITFLLDHPFQGHRGLDEALFLAITLEFSDVTRLLLDRGAKPDALRMYRISENVDPPSKTLAVMSPLHVAVRKRDLDLCKLLLEHKADPNLLPDLQKPSLAGTTMPNYPTGTPLHDAVVSSLEVTRLLLDHGADVTVASPDSGFTALHSAVRPSHLVGYEDGDQAQILKLLLEKGAHLEAKTVGEPDSKTKPNRSGNQDSSIPPGTTPLMMATLSNNFAAVRVLVEAGAATSDPALLNFAIRSKNLDWVQLLVSAPGKPAISTDALVEAVRVESAAIVRLLAQAGADPNALSPKHEITPLREAAKLETADLLQLLIDLGAKPDPEWTSRNYEGSNISNLPLLYRHSLVPIWQEKPAITAITPFAGELPPVELDTGSSGSPGTFEELLMNPAIRWPLVNIGSNNHFPTRFTVWRKNADAIEGSLDETAALPELRWGDVLEFKPDWEKIGGNRTSFNTLYHDGLPPDVQWHVRKRIAFPVTVEIDGVSRNLTLRGDGLLFDPSADQVPLVGASRLASLLWQPEFSQDGLEKPELSVVREGWPDVSVPWNPSSRTDFPLKSGDRLVIKTPPPPNDVTARRKGHVVVRGHNLPFLRIYGHLDAATDYSQSLPSLIQALADAGSYNTETLRSAPSDPTAFPPLLLRSPDFPIQLLPHPDYSKIVIRRLNPDGTEKGIPVDLAAVIANSTADTTPEEARKADVELEPGDIVEIPQLPGLAGTPWKGFSEAESRFFAKALDCKVQVISEEGGIELCEIRYQAPRFIEIAGQPIPLPPLSGVDTLNAGAVLGQDSSSIHIDRKGNLQKNLLPSKAYLRDGDVIHTSQSPGRQRPAPAIPSGSRQPRPRIVPPPSPSR